MDTKLIGIGLRTDERTGALSTPIYQCATFAHPALGESTGFDYSRTANPTRQVLEQGIADLEGGSKGFAFATGLAALTAILLLFKPGDHLVVTEDLYGGTYRMLEAVFGDLGITATFVDTTDLEQVRGALRDNTRAILVETPTNPLLKVADVEALVALAREQGLLTIVDNTFLTPIILRPLELGADIVVHSGTKYLGGHNDLLAGVVVAREEALCERIGFLQNSLGAVLGAFDSWLLIRGLKTLALRMERQQANALQLASWLQSHPGVKKVYYPGLPEHQGHDLLKDKGFGAMVSFVVEGQKVVEKVLKRVKIISFAESLGGVESLITFPAVQTHSAIPEETRERLGIDNGLLRLSVGAENIEDLIADLEQALA
ncbi:MAG TPA: PLP-dependent aspartate aminotransferase family protein [Bacillota bacterium]|nr:PLP-dependent aspartate aminotransferase family protein [Bacillota bacterium]